eukprot:TRINITY_DN16858_c0_g1_i1.p1 TRINITY_DN16858_c0_g1~~TRINITY_DN16858_c0_g1_i1.p1  ORF type:complete len:282 (-),score=57.91 TRINITY_DN16858_c0_g1_i1:116-934(-)
MSSPLLPLLLLVVLVCLCHTTVCSSIPITAASATTSDGSVSSSPRIEGTFTPDRMRLIDSRNSSQGVTNFMFRGDDPLNANHTFDRAGLSKQMAIVAANASLSFPEEYYLVCVSFLSVELPDVLAEKEYFRENPNNGTLVSWPILGTEINPLLVDEKLRMKMAAALPNWEIDQLANKTAQLLIMLQQDGPRGLPLVLYLHCEAGMDRTGEVSGSYYVRNLGWDFQTALAYDNNIESTRNIKIASQNAFQWYCLYLSTTPEFQSLNCTIPAGQ